MIDTNEQWKLDGNCSACRKRKYCGTECNRHKTLIERKVRSLVTEAMDERTNGMYSQVMSHLYMRK